MRFGTRSTVLSASAVGVVALAASCREPTQVTVTLTTGEKCGNLSSVQTIVSPDQGTTQTRFEQRFTSAAASSCDASGLIGTLVIVPGGAGATLLVAVGVRVGDAPPPDAATCADPVAAKHCIIARRSFAFLDHTSLALPIRLDPLCIGTTCDPASTCFKGSCVDANVTCNGSDCGLPQEHPGEGSGTDAGSGDGAYDADLDGSGFEDGARDSGDAAIVDGSPDADGAVDQNAPPCGRQGALVYCYAPSGAGVSTAGGCTNPGDNTKFCCRCTCTASATVVSCETSMSSGQSCHPACP